MPRAFSTRSVAAVALSAAVLAVVLIAAGGGHDHKLVAVLGDANYITPGTKVVIAGNKVGKVSTADVTSDGRARLTLDITDDRAWPLNRGTGLRLRWLGTIAYAGRYVELDVPKGGPPLADGATIGLAAQPVEFDDVFSTFDPATRADLRRTIRSGGAALGPAAMPLRRALRAAPPALEEARAVMEDLGADTGSLDVLVRSTDRVLASVQRSDPGLRQLIDGAAGTFAATAARQRQLSGALDQAAPTLATAKGTLARADRTLRLAATLTARLDPGTRALQRLTPPLQSALARIREVGPAATSTLADLRRATPQLNPFLTRARQLMPQIASVAQEGAKQLNCVRPYAPEVAGLASTWAGFEIQGDSKDKYARLYTPAMPYDVLPLSPGQAAKQFPSLHFAFPRPPGEVAGQPWFIPECGLGPDTVDPSKDPEAPR